MNKRFSSFDEQKKRCDLISRLATANNLKKFSPDGKWMGEKILDILREQLYFCLAFLRSGEKEATVMANKILKKSEYIHCHFAPMIAIQILLKYSSMLDAESKERLELYVKEELDFFVGPDLDFVGVNDNFPSMATFTLLAGGEMFHRPDLYEDGKKRLMQLKALLTRRGVATEYNSPTYTPIQLLAISEIANLVKDSDVRETARKCEERLWADVLGHLHKEVSQVAGPFSRAYTLDSMGHTSLARCSLYALLGDLLPVNIQNTVFESENGQLGECLHLGASFLQISAVWLMDSLYVCPDYLIDLALNKTYPYEFIASTEYSSSTDAATNEETRDPYCENETYEYPAGTGRISTYMTADYAMGTATHEFHNGIQTDSFHILYGNRIPVVHQRDLRTIYARYIINEKMPDAANYLLEDEGRKICIQEKNSAVVLYKPKIVKRLNVQSLKLSLVIPVQYGMPDEIWLGGTKVEQEYAESMEACSVYIMDGPVYMAFHPIILSNYGRKAAVKIEKQQGFLVISFYNYEGASKDFAARGFLLTGNGFAAEIRSKSEAGSFEAFRKQSSEYEINDLLQISVHSRQTYIRKTRYSRKGLTIECEYSPVSEGIKLMSVNGKAIEQPKLQISDFDVSRLPFM